MNLKEIREGKGMSQRELSRMTGISARTIGRYEAGEACPDTQRIKLLCQALEIEPDELEGGKMPDQNKTEKRMCPFRTDRGTRGGVIFSKCLGDNCMGYRNGMCQLAGRRHSEALVRNLK